MDNKAENYKLNVTKDNKQIICCFNAFHKDFKEMKEGEQRNSEIFDFKTVQFFISAQRGNSNNLIVFKIIPIFSNHNHWSFFAYFVRFLAKPVVADCQHKPEFVCKCVKEIFSNFTYNCMFKGSRENLHTPILECKMQLNPKAEMEICCSLIINNLCDITLSPNRSIMFTDKAENDFADKNDNFIELIIDCKAIDDDGGVCKFYTSKKDLFTASTVFTDDLTDNKIRLTEKCYTKDDFIDLMRVLLSPFMSLSFFDESFDTLEFFCYFAHRYQCFDMQMRLTDFLLKMYEPMTLITLADRYSMTRMLCSAVSLTDKSNLIKAVTCKNAYFWSENTKLITLDRLQRFILDEAKVRRDKEDLNDREEKRKKYYIT